MNLCKCGCGIEIIIKRHHKWAGVPNFVHGHNGRGRIVSEETKKLLSEQKFGDMNPSKRNDVRNKMIKKALINWQKDGYREAHSGENAPMYNKRHTDEAKLKTKIAMTGENNPCWNGGISKLPYSQDWTEDLKDAIRKRDGYSCRLCSIHQKELEEKIHVHHVDYDKKNCNPENLISLCRSCHMKTNWGREKWGGFFNEILEERTINA
jgi:glutamate mutase epsilon subunit